MTETREDERQPATRRIEGKHSRSAARATRKTPPTTLPGVRGPALSRRFSLIEGRPAAPSHSIPLD